MSFMTFSGKCCRPMSARWRAGAHKIARGRAGAAAFSEALLHPAAGLGLLEGGGVGAVVGDRLLALDGAQLVVGERNPLAAVDVGELVADALLHLAPRLVGGVGASAGGVADTELGRDRGAAAAGDAEAEGAGTQK